MATITEEQREAILKLWEAGELTKAEIARVSGVSRPTVYKVIREEDEEEPVSEEENEGEIYAEEEEDAETGEEDEFEVEEEVGEEDDAGELYTDEEDEDEEPEETPAAVVLGSPASAAVGLAVGIGLGTAGLYYAMMRGFLPAPGPGKAEG